MTNLLTKIFGKKEEAPYKPETLSKLSSSQQSNYDKYKVLLSGFYLGRDIMQPNDSGLYIGVSDGYLGSTDIGMITEDGMIHLLYATRYPNATNEGIKEIIDETLFLRKTLEDKGIDYVEDVNREEYANQVQRRLDKDTLDFVNRIRQS